MRPYPEKTLHKTTAGRVAQGIGPKFKPQNHKKREREREKKVPKIIGTHYINYIGVRSQQLIAA
jgi:hypothetical protein